MELPLCTPSNGIKPAVYRVCMENEIQMNWWSHLWIRAEEQQVQHALAEHTQPNRKREDDNEKIKAVVLAALKRENAT